MPRGYCPSDLSRSEILAEARGEAIAAAAEDLNKEMREQLDAMVADYDALRVALEKAHDALLSIEGKTAVYDTLHTTPDETSHLFGSLHTTATDAREAAANALDGEDA